MIQLVLMNPKEKGKKQTSKLIEDYLEFICKIIKARTYHTLLSRKKETENNFLIKVSRNLDHCIF